MITERFLASYSCARYVWPLCQGGAQWCVFSVVMRDGCGLRDDQDTASLGDKGQRTDSVQPWHATFNEKNTPVWSKRQNDRGVYQWNHLGLKQNAQRVIQPSETFSDAWTELGHWIFSDSSLIYSWDRVAQGHRTVGKVSIIKCFCCCVCAQNILEE